MRTPTMSILTLVIFGASTTAAASPFTVEAGNDVASTYIWRGYTLTDEIAIQPSTTLTWNDTGLSLNVWGSFASTDREAWDSTDEVDLTLNFTRPIEAMDRELALSVGFIEYAFPNAEIDHTEEIYASIVTDLPGSLGLTTFYDFGAVEAWYLRSAAAQQWPIANREDTSLTLSASLGVGDYGHDFGWHDAATGITLSRTFGAFRVLPSLGVSLADDTVNPDDTEIWGLLGLRWNP